MRSWAGWLSRFGANKTDFIPPSSAFRPIQILFFFLHFRAVQGQKHPSILQRSHREPIVVAHFTLQLNSWPLLWVYVLFHSVFGMLFCMKWSFGPNWTPEGMGYSGPCRSDGRPEALAPWSLLAVYCVFWRLMYWGSHSGLDWGVICSVIMCFSFPHYVVGLVWLLCWLSAH